MLQVYSLLEDHIKQPRFLKQLEEAKEGNTEPDACLHGCEVFQEEWWEAPKGAAEMDSDEGFLEVPIISPAAFLSFFNFRNLGPFTVSLPHRSDRMTPAGLPAFTLCDQP